MKILILAFTIYGKTLDKQRVYPSYIC